VVGDAVATALGWALVAHGGGGRDACSPLTRGLAVDLGIELGSVASARSARQCGAEQILKDRASAGPDVTSHVPHLRIVG
jgi:hypothetical protein